MAVKIRLKRVGAKKDPHYRVVVTDSRSPRDGRFIEEIGYFDASGNEGGVSIIEEKALHWLMVGAQPSHTVRNMFKELGIMARFAEMKQQASQAES